jgi:hypothetical protein
MTEVMKPDEVAALAENLDWGSDEFARVTGADSEDILTGMNFTDGRVYRVGIGGGASDEQILALESAVQEMYDCLRVERDCWEEKLVPEDPSAGTEEVEEVLGEEITMTSYDPSELVTTEFEGVKAELGERC